MVNRDYQNTRPRNYHWAAYVPSMWIITVNDRSHITMVIGSC